jgi:hypothetical protein
MNRFAAVILAVALLAPGVARAEMRLSEWKGHIALGFAHVISDSLSPPGSLSVSAGVDYPIGRGWRVGPAIAFNLLGSSTLTRGSITAQLDYSMFDAALLFTRTPATGPVARWSVGPGVASPHADLTLAAGGAGFRDVALGEIRPELAADASFLPRHLTIVSVGGELSARVVPIPARATWYLLAARLAIHF